MKKMYAETQVSTDLLKVDHRVEGLGLWPVSLHPRNVKGGG